MIRRVKNRHGSALAACNKWLAGSLWGIPIQLGPNKYHVYGCWRYRRLVSVEFKADCIWIVNGCTIATRSRRLSSTRRNPSKIGRSHVNLRLL